MSIELNTPIFDSLVIICGFVGNPSTTAPISTQYALATNVANKERVHRIKKIEEMKPYFPKTLTSRVAEPVAKRQRVVEKRNFSSLPGEILGKIHHSLSERAQLFELQKPGNRLEQTGALISVKEKALQNEATVVFLRGLGHFSHLFPEAYARLPNLDPHPLEERARLIHTWMQEESPHLNPIISLFQHAAYKLPPPCLQFLTGLVSLDLSRNSLKELGPEIGELRNLRSLDVSDNHLVSLPSEIGKLGNLQELNLSSNRLKSLPSTIGELNSLAHLNLINNRLTYTEREITNLFKKRIYLVFNSFSTGPIDRVAGSVLIRVDLNPLSRA